MEGRPSAGFVNVVLLLLAAVTLALVGAASAVMYLWMGGRAVRLIHRTVLALIVLVNAALAILSPPVWLGYVVGGSVESAREDLPVLTLLPAVPFLLAFAFLAPLVQRAFRRRA